MYDTVNRVLTGQEQLMHRELKSMYEPAYYQEKIKFLHLHAYFKDKWHFQDTSGLSLNAKRWINNHGYQCRKQE